MQTGTIISATVHVSLLSLAFLSGLDLWPVERIERMQVTSVTLVRSQVFDVMPSAAPAMPLTDMLDQTAPDASFQAPVAPDADIAPVETEMDVTEDPDSADLEPDLSALERLAQPEVVNVQPVFDSAPEFSDSAPAIFRPAQDGNELNAPISMMAPPPPRNAPRIDTTAAEAPPPDATPDIENTQAVTEDGQLELENEAQEATATPESTTEITPEGQEDVEIANYAPQSAARPPARPRQLARAQAEPEQTEDDAILAAILATQAAQQAEAAQTPVVAELTGIEKASIGEAISRRWNKVAITGLPDYEDLVVRVAVSVDSFGNIESDVTPVEPEDPTGYYLNAFRAARSAILQSGQIPLPAGVFPDGVRLILRFDPASGEVGLN